MMALGLLGIVVSPVLAYAGDLHGTKHVSGSLQANADDHRQLDKANTDGNNVADSGGDAGDVLHGLMHVCHVHDASAGVLFPAMIAMISPNHVVVFPPTAPMMPLQHISGPFRPPIA